MLEHQRTNRKYLCINSYIIKQRVSTNTLCFTMKFIKDFNFCVKSQAIISWRSMGYCPGNNSYLTSMQIGLHVNVVNKSADEHNDEYTIWHVEHIRAYGKGFRCMLLEEQSSDPHVVRFYSYVSHQIGVWSDWTWWRLISPFPISTYMSTTYLWYIRRRFNMWLSSFSRINR